MGGGQGVHDDNGDYDNNTFIEGVVKDGSIYTSVLHVLTMVTFTTMAMIIASLMPSLDYGGVPGRGTGKD